ncbi:MAG TPA: hypothetical protein VFM53_00695 [Anaeromyxobacteraceae bacterium]|nr:hypothetical protein [Anaeromyxobacteraceae bacterium]
MTTPRAALLAALVAALALPAQAPAQAPGGGPPPGAGQGAGPGPGPGAGGGRGAWMDPEVRERVERRLRLARSLGLAEALDLDEAGTARLAAVMAPFDARRKAVLDGLQADLRTIRLAARGKGRLAEVDGAVQRVFEGRAQLLAIDREMFQALAKGMPAEQVARMALFFARFRQRFGMEMPDAAGAPAR